MRLVKSINRTAAMIDGFGADYHSALVGELISC